MRRSENFEQELNPALQKGVLNNEEDPRTNQRVAQHFPSPTEKGFPEITFLTSAPADEPLPTEHQGSQSIRQLSAGLLTRLSRSGGTSPEKGSVVGMCQDWVDLLYAVQEQAVDDHPLNEHERAQLTMMKQLVDGIYDPKTGRLRIGVNEEQSRVVLEGWSQQFKLQRDQDEVRKVLELAEAKGAPQQFRLPRAQQQSPGHLAFVTNDGTVYEIVSGNDRQGRPLRLKPEVVEKRGYLEVNAGDTPDSRRFVDPVRGVVLERVVIDGQVLYQENVELSVRPVIEPAPSLETPSGRIEICRRLYANPYTKNLAVELYHQMLSNNGKLNEQGQERLQEIWEFHLKQSSSNASKTAEGAPLTGQQEKGLEAAKAQKASGLNYTNRQLVIGLLVDTLEREGENWTEDTRDKFTELIERYRQGDAKVVAAVHNQLNIQLPTDNVENRTELTPTSKPAEQLDSKRDLQRVLQSPAERAALVAKILEKGAIRSTLIEAGMPEEKAKTLERELLSEKEEESKKAAREIKDFFEKGRGGVRTFASKVGQRLGAIAIVSSLILPAILFVPGTDSGGDATWR